MADELVDEVFACAICLELMHEPTTLACGHSFCGACIEQCFVDDVRHSTLTCPQCRVDIIYPQPRRPLTKNYAIEQAIEVIDRRRRTEEEARERWTLTVRRA